tara:strand:- start:785 stop:970 length:186 start_codon:yes stop_codon:yes gene_type:complete
MNNYVIQLNIGKRIYHVNGTSKECAFKSILSHERCYNPEWGYKVLRIDNGHSVTLKKECRT